MVFINQYIVLSLKYQKTVRNSKSLFNKAKDFRSIFTNEEEKSKFWNCPMFYNLLYK